MTVRKRRLPPNGPKGSGKGEKGKDPKGKGKGNGKDKGDPKGGQPKKPPKKPKAKGEGKGGKAESKAPPKGNPPKAPCLFFPKGTCTRGENCPFSHETAPGKSSAPKASGAAATAKSSAAAVALTLPTTARGSSVVGSSTPNKTTFWKRSGLSSLFRTIVGWFSVLHNAVPAVLPNESKSTLPVMQTGPYHVEWISDSGAGRILTSLKALSQQGIPSDVMQHVAHSHPVSFATENGVYTSDEVLTSVGADFGNSTSYVMDDCPIVRSLGELV